MAQIIHNGNDYLSTVKGHQPKLFEQLQTRFEQAPAQSVERQTGQTCDRPSQRTVSVMSTVAELDPLWLGIQRVIRVERVGTRAKQLLTETMFYSSLLSLDATGLAQCLALRYPWVPQ